MRVNQCPSCGGFCKKSGCERRDNIVPCKHFRAGMTNKSKEECPYCRIESLEATAPQWHDAPTVPGVWICDEGDICYTWTAHNIEILDQFDPGDGLRWYGPIPEDRQ